MRRWTAFTLLAIMLLFGSLGCGGGSSSSFTITVSPTAASVILNTSFQFTSLINGNTNQTVKWTLACATGVTSCGSVDSTSGLYTAPSALPSTPTVTITATSQADTTKTAAAIVTIISGVAIAVAPTSATIATNEHFTLAASVSNPGCNFQSDSTCFNVTWAITTTNDGNTGTVDANGNYTAPSAVPTSPTITITATSVKDTSITSSATVTIVAAADPTLSSVSPKTIGLGSVFQDVFIAGTKFLATTIVYVNGVPLPPANVINVSGSGLVATLGAQPLAVPPSSGILQITTSQQNGGQQACTPDVTACQIVIVPTHPALIGTSPESIPEGFAGSLNFNANGGFFGTTQSPAVNATYDGQARTASVLTTADPCPSTANPCTARQLSVVIGGGNLADFGTPGLHQVTVHSSTDPTQFAATNLAVQPDENTNAPTAGAPISVGSSPVDVAIDNALGLAVVANHNSNNVTLIDMTHRTVVAGSICTGSLGQQTSACAASGPVTVAAGRVQATGQDIALVANSTSKNIAVINLNTQTVTALIPLQDAPAGVGFNPVTGRGLVSMNTRGYGVLLDLTQATPAIAGVVTISSGPNSHVAVEPHLNWALATPGGGGVGTLSIVNLNQQTVNKIVSVSRSTGIVTVNVQASTSTAPQPPLAIQVGDAVSIQGISDNSFNGIYTVTSVGAGIANCTSGITCFSYSEVNNNPPDVPTLTNVTGTANYSQPVATAAVTTTITGVGIDTETKQAVLTDPTSAGSVTFFRLLDQTVSSLTLEPGYVAGAFNPLTNIALVVNQVNNQLSVLDPTTPKRLPTSTSVFPTGNHPIAIAVDASTNQAIVINQTDNSATIYGLGLIRSVSITTTSPTTFELDSTLSAAAPTPANQTLTILGAGFSASSVPRLDGTPLAVQSVDTLGRVLTATVPGGMLTKAHTFAVDVKNADGTISNVEDFSVIQSVDVSSGTGCSTPPLPTGVAVDSQQGRSGLAVVTLFGCNTAAVIDLSSGTGTTVAVGNSPQGVAVLPNLHSAVIANNGSASASVVDYLGDQVTDTVPVGTGPAGVAVDPATNEAAVTNSVDNTVSVLSISPGVSGVSNTISTGQRPVAVSFNYTTHEVAVGSTGANTVNIGDAAGTALGVSFSATLPTKILYDPSANTFLVNQSTSNLLSILDPTTQQQSNFRVGINPTDVAYNYLTSTLVTTNTASRTLTVVDFLDSASSSSDRLVRDVLTLPPAPPTSTLTLTGSLQFGVDLVPLTNLAVVADTANGKVLLIPLPH